MDTYKLIMIWIMNRVQNNATMTFNANETKIINQHVNCHLKQAVASRLINKQLLPLEVNNSRNRRFKYP